MKRLTNGIGMHLVNNKRLRAGFTLIELLVVIAIISLLVSILLPSLKKAKDLAKRAVCAVQMRTICTGINVYTGDYDGKLPFVTTTWIYNSSYQRVDNPSFNNMFGNQNLLRDEFFPYEAMDCPGDDTREEFIDYWPYWGSGELSTNLSYAYNGRLVQRAESPPYGKFWYQARTIDDWPWAADNVAMFEVTPPIMAPNYHAQMGGYENTGHTTLSFFGELHHGDGHNFGFLDAHVEFASEDEYVNSLGNRGDELEVPGRGIIPFNFFPEL